MPLSIRIGDLFDAPEQTIVNAVNCHGVMGKGIALEFKRRYPSMFQDYMRRCALPLGHPEKLVVGRPYFFRDGSTSILNFPTKDHWRHPSRVEWIDDGLRYFAEQYQAWGVSLAAFRCLGCDNGRLDWESQVRPLMESRLSGLDIPVAIVLYLTSPEARRFDVAQRAMND